MITVNDLRNDNLLSGFHHVTLAGTPALPKPYQARYGQGKEGCAPGTPLWRGPRRATAAEAALDYCQYVNGNGATPATPALKSAGHVRTSTPRTWSEGVQKLRQQLRDAIAVEREAEGLQGCLYLIGEALTVGQQPTTSDDGTVLVSGRAVKVGYSETPDVRIGNGQTFNPRVLVLLGTIPDKTKDDESAMHGKYIEDNVLQEWFRPTKALLSEFGVKIGYVSIGSMWVKNGEV